MQSALIIIAIVGLTAIGDYFLKVASGKASAFTSLEFVAGAAFYALSAGAWVLVMKHLPLSTIGVLYADISLIVITLLGVVVFGEKIGVRELLGIAFAIAALSLMSKAH